MVTERKREGPPGCPEPASEPRPPWEARPGEPPPGGGGGAPKGGPGSRPLPGARARRGQPGRREPPAGGTGHAQTAARSRRERASAPPARATYLGACAPGCYRYGPARSQRARGRVRGDQWPGSRKTLPRPHPSPGARRTRGRVVDKAARGPGATSGQGGGASAVLTWWSPGGREQAGPGGARSRAGSGTRRRGVGVRSYPGRDRRHRRSSLSRRPRRVQRRRDPLPGAEGAHSPQAASQARRPDLVGYQGESASRLSKMAFPGPGTNSSANKSSLFRGRYGMIYQVPAVRQLQWRSAVSAPSPPEIPIFSNLNLLRSCGCLKNSWKVETT